MCICAIGVPCQLRPRFYASSFAGLGRSICEVFSFLVGLNLGVSKNRGTPKWMVYNGLECSGVNESWEK